MMPSNNPTAMSAVVGEEILLAAGPGRRAELLKELIMPVLLAAFATYFVVGMITMRVPEGTAFPGPRFFPGLIAAGLYLFAILLGGTAVRNALRPRAAQSRTVGSDGDAFELLSAEHDAVRADDLAREGTELTADGTPVPGKAVGVDWRSLAWVVGSFLAFAMLLPYLGWVIAAALLFWCVSRAFGLQQPLAALIVGFTVSSLIYIAFDIMLGMSLPSGVLGWGF
ncbi:putative tricarboxylic transport membrane protein [Leucobacter luti]|uniref:tripartite tricarboxylate transporter TctB family protein n=1 Tax=Leucobacter luti TaxID=340320 RepID=UPI00105324CB|nr:tripartite tricarboxylate transporter TctB family protein [Leucobacter luti]MCW2289500.1 putative tricarboxylic transport membrane protein [Leucobacter luti]TCK33889.1 putative tricarboxylic transport membrane protein [Leucobacter luti]